MIGVGSDRRATRVGLVSILLWSTSVPVSRLVLEGFGLLPGAALVFLVAGGLLLGFTSLRERGLSWTRRLSPKHLLFAGPLFVAYLLALYGAVGLAVSRIEAVAAGLANYIWPSMVLIFSAVLLRSRPRWWRLGVGIVASLLGILLAASASVGGPWHLAVAISRPSAAIGLGLIAGVLWALYSVVARLHAQAISSGAVGLFLVAVGAGLAAFAGKAWIDVSWDGPSTGAMVYMAVLPNSLAYWLWDEAVKRGDIATLGALSNLIPVLSVLVGTGLLSIGVRVELLGGACLVVAGSFLARLAFSSPAGQGSRPTAG